MTKRQSKSTQVPGRWPIVEAALVAVALWLVSIWIVNADDLTSREAAGLALFAIVTGNYLGKAVELTIKRHRAVLTRTAERIDNTGVWTLPGYGSFTVREDPDAWPYYLVQGLVGEDVEIRIEELWSVSDVKNLIGAAEDDGFEPLKGDRATLRIRDEIWEQAGGGTAPQRYRCSPGPF